MEKVRLEDVNGTLMLAIPPTIPDHLELEAGSEVELALEKNETVVRIARPRKYRLADLIAKSDPRAFEKTEEDLEWLNAPAVGRELI